MPSRKISPAELDDGSSGNTTGLPYSRLYDDVYHTASDPWAQAQGVFMALNGLPGRWQARDRFVILETGFGLGNNFLATWAAWRADPRRCAHLFFISIEKHPVRRDDLARVHTASAEPALAERLLQAWPPLTPGLHTLHFDEPELAGRVTLLLGLGDVAELLPSLVASVDAFYLDGFAPAKNPAMWDGRWLSRLGRWAAPGATAATWSVARGVRDALAQAGFEVERVEGFGGKRDMTVARYAPRFTPPPLSGGIQPAPRKRHAAVIGAGLAGCATAWALTREGWYVTVLDRHDTPAGEASGNPGGLYHGIVHGDDGIHARVHRAAALATDALAAPWIHEKRLPGQADGLLRLDAKITDDAAAALLEKLGWPSDFLRWLPQAQASQTAGTALPSGAWLFGQGGWLHPAGYAALMLEGARKTGRLTWQGGAEVRALKRVQRAPAASDESGAHRWQVLGSSAEVLTEADSVVLACAMGVNPLLESLGLPPLPLSAVRGQLSVLPADCPGLQGPAIPVAGGGYALRLDDGQVLCGATTQHHDPSPELREADHRHNLRQAARLGVLPPQANHADLLSGLSGRVGWRATTPDRLPLIGAMPDPAANDTAPSRLDQPRLAPRLRNADGGLYVLSGLGSRGIGWAALAGQLLAHWMEGTPCPIEADLRDALDPARFTVRQWRERMDTTPVDR